MKDGYERMEDGGEEDDVHHPHHSNDTDTDHDGVSGVTISIKKLSLHVHDYKFYTPFHSLNKKLNIGGSCKTEQVLHSVSAKMPAGSLIAIMGPSGCGKTSLLNAMSGRIKQSKNVSMYGDILFNGQHATPAMIENLTGYVLQGDFLHPHLTVYETLACSAMLRLPSNLTKAQKMAKVEAVISELGLRHCRNNRIGNDEKRGLSGGEKRRVSIAMQLLTNPSILYLDEPTSGLDSFMARNVMEALVRLAEQGRTVICTIHQPRSDIFHLFDSVLLLSKGKMVYYGKTKDATRYFQSLGYNCPSKCNPADFILDIASVDNRNQKAEAEGKARVKKLTDHYASMELAAAARASPVPDYTPVPIQPHKKPGFFLEFYVLLVRSARNLYRDKSVLLVGLFEAAMVSCMIGCAFFRLDETLAGIRSRMALFYTICHLQSYIILTYNTYQLTRELPIFDRERQDNLYRVISFVLARSIASFPIEILFPVIFSSIVYWMTGLWPDFVHFAMFSVVCVCHLYGAVAWAWMCASVTRNFAWAALFANSLSIFCGLSCGFLINPTTVPDRIAWFRLIDPLRYAFDLMMVNEFGSGRQFACPSENPAECALYNGSDILTSAGVKNLDMGFLFGMQCVIIAFFRTSAFLILYFFPRVPTMGAPIPPPLTPSSTPYGTFSSGIHEITSPLCITLDEVGVKIDTGKQSPKAAFKEARRRCRLIALGAQGEYTWKERLWDEEEAGVAMEEAGKEETTSVSVLRNVTGSLTAGELVVLMGGSGSGKTSLLNAIAGRGDTKVTGDILINGRDMRDELKLLTGYVLQNDYLHACLTVRECLRYIAMLRLPASLPVEEKDKRVDEIIHELGLKDCAHTLIGDDFVRGISGGEKRRVSIAAQMLTDPSILLLDEPTSGLDAFTAHNIIDTLRRIARQGRIILCSIHQPRSDIFHMFDSVILLTKGDVAYFGPSKNILEHFTKLGYECPNDTNPADFLLDVTSIDDRDSTKEAETSARVSGIVSQWASLPSPLLLSPSSSRSPSPSLPVVFSPKSPGKQHTSNKTITLLRPLMKKPNSFFTAVPVLMKRSFRNMTRQPLFMISRIMQAIGYGSILSVYYTHLTNDQNSVQNRIGLLYMVISCIFVGMLNDTAFFPPERNVFYRENADGSYSSLSFYLMYTLSEIPFDAIMSIIFSMIMYFIIGIEFTWDNFSMFCFIVFLAIFSGESVGALMNMFIYDVGMANALTSSILSFFGIMAGFVTNSMIPFLDGLNTISIMKYAAAVISIDHFKDMTFTCDTDYCPFKTGEDVLDFYGFDKDKKWHAFGAMVGCAIGYRLFGGLVLHFLKKKYAQ